MAITATEIVAAFSESGFTGETLAAFLVRAKLQTDKQTLVAQLSNLEAAEDAAVTASQAAIQAKQAEILAVQAEIDALEA